MAISSTSGYPPMTAGWRASVQRALPVLALLLIVFYVDALAFSFRDHSPSGNAATPGRAGAPGRAQRDAAAVPGSSLAAISSFESGRPALRRMRRLVPLRELAGAVAAAAAAAASTAAAARPTKSQLGSRPLTARSSNALFAGFAADAKAALPTRPPLSSVGGVAVAPPAPPLAPHCFDSLGFNRTRDAYCYFESAAGFDAELAADEHGPYCWGHSGREAGGGNTGAASARPLLFQTAVIRPREGSVNVGRLLTHSFLATQCCDAQLWIWVGGDHFAAFSAEFGAALGSSSNPRLVIKRYDAEAEWAGVAPDFPGSNTSTLAHLAGGSVGVAKAEDEMASAAEWARLLLLYAYGGVYVDYDTLFLRDWRPVVDPPTHEAFGLRFGFNIYLSGSVLAMRPRPSEQTRGIIAAVLKEVSVQGVSAWRRVWVVKNSGREVWRMFSSLIDCWVTIVYLV